MSAQLLDAVLELGEGVHEPVEVVATEIKQLAEANREHGHRVVRLAVLTE